MDYRIHYTGHPFVDVGVATTLAIVGKRQPHELTYDDLRQAAQQLLYFFTNNPDFRPDLKNFFPNARFVQPKMTHQDKLDYIQNTLFAFEQDTFATEKGEKCTYFPELSSLLRARRFQVPLLNSVETANFSPMGNAGLPVSGLALFFIHAMPLGCGKCSGKFLIFHQLDRPDENNYGIANWIMAKTHWEHNAKHLSLHGKMVSIGNYKRTRYVDGLLRARDTLAGNFNLHNISGYYFTNYGTGAEMEILQLSNAVVDFVDAAQQDQREAWEELVQSSWVEEKTKEEEQPTDIRLTWRNRLFESLFYAEERPHDFLKMLVGSLKESQYRGRFGLVRLFMRKVMNMQDAEINLYVDIGHRLAEYVNRYDYNAKRKSLSWAFYHSLKEARYDQLIKLLRAAREKVSRSGEKEPLIPIEDFIRAFVRTRRTYGQYELARDLVAYAMFDKLHEMGHTMHGSSTVLDEDDENAQEYLLAVQTNTEEE